MSVYTDLKDNARDLIDLYFFPTDRMGDPVYVGTGFAILMLPFVLPFVLAAAVVWLIGRAVWAVFE
jgi:hypothetical protein